MKRSHRSSLAALVLAVAPACGHSSPAATSAPPLASATHSGPLAISPDGARLYVVHPDADLVTVVDVASGATLLSIPLGSSPPALDTSDPAMPVYHPAVGPRALALDPSGKTLFVSGQWSGHVYAFDAATGERLADASVCAEPIGVLPDAAGANVFVACSQDDSIFELAAADLSVVASVSTPHKPWALAWAPDGATLLSTHLLGWGDDAVNHPANLGVSSPGVTAFTSSPLALEGTWQVVDGPAGTVSTTPHGQVRGVYDAVARPGSDEVWALHVMLGTDTAQPDLDFQNTVFPAITILGSDGTTKGRLTVSTTPGDGNAIGDIVSGPRALTFSPDGRYAFVADAASEDILVIDAALRVEAALVRPMPGHQQEGVVWGPGGKLYVQERNTEDIAVVDLGDAPDGSVGVAPTVETAVLGKLEADPMPANLRLGQHLFNSANSDEYPITSNHWASCTTCHIEGRSDAVTWKFAEGPRDTPSNAGGVSQTGFLFRNAARTSVTDYWATINSEQGGDFQMTEPTQVPLLEALRNYVDEAIPYPVPPTAYAPTSALAQAGAAVFASAHCADCHAGPYMTDSAMGNPTKDLGGPIVQVVTPGGVVLHSVGTCVTAPFPDAITSTIDGQTRPACLFDTPTLRGLSDSAPYLHDGSALTLEDAVDVMLAGAHNDPSGKNVPYQLSPTDKTALVAYLKSN